MKILKAKVKDSSVEVVFEDKEKQIVDGNFKFSDEPHPDLINAMKRLTKHLVVLCDQKESDLVITDDFEQFDVSQLGEIKVTGISIGGEDDYEGVTITGQKKLKNGKVLNLNTPFTQFLDEEYDYADYLFNDISKVIIEVKDFINGKRAAVQQELKFEQSPA